jgi:hypothetical protein
MQGDSPKREALPRMVSSKKVQSLSTAKKVKAVAVEQVAASRTCNSIHLDK